MTTRHKSLLWPTLAISLLTLGQLAAQGPERSRLGAQPSAPEREGELPPMRPLLALPGAAPEDDAPDYGPMRAIPEENGEGSRLVSAGDPYVLSFSAGDYKPEPGIDPRMRALQLREPAGSTYGYIMIQGRMADARLEQLRAMGVAILDVHTWQSVVAEIPLMQLQRIEALDFVRWVGYPQPAQKLGRRLTRAMQHTPVDARLDVHISLYVADSGGEPSERVVGESRKVGQIAVESPIREVMPNGRMQRTLEALGFEPTFYNRRLHMFRGHATPAQLRAIQVLDEVRTLELFDPHSSCHDQALAMIGQDRIRGSWPGRRVSVGIIDTGIDASPWHQDLGSKHYHGWRATSALPSSYADGDGHGTHVAGTIMGTGTADRRYMGCAPAVGSAGWNDVVYIGRYLDDNGSGKGNVTNLYNTFSSSQSTNGQTSPRPMVVNNSWGSKSSSGYDGSEAASRDVDDVVWDHSQSYVFAAGNKDNVANWWAGAPGVAKNVITVGALADRWDGSNVPGEVASFSRYGTKDGRRKPEVCAPGDRHTSCNINTSTGYTNKSGTSMATPTVVGAIASLIDRDPGFSYRPEVVKAALVASATLNGDLYSDSKRGYGIINSYKLNKAGTTYYSVGYGTITKSGNSLYADVPIAANVKAVRVVISWVEPKASSLASAARRNDVRMFLDVAPFSGGGDTGEFKLSSGRDNTLSYSSYYSTSTGFARAAAGKTVRIKAYGHSIKSLDDVRVGLAVIQYYKEPKSSLAPSLSVTPATTILKPNQYLPIDTELKAHASADNFSDARIWYASPTSWDMINIQRTTADSILQIYNNLNNHPSASFPRVQSGSNGGMIVGQGSRRKLRFTLLSPKTRGQHYLEFQASYHSGSAIKRGVFVCVDDQAPGKINNLKSTTHSVGVWSNKPQITFTWNKAADYGCAGLQALHYRRSTGSYLAPTKSSPTQSASQSWHQWTPGSSTQGRYFGVAAKDKLDHFGSDARTGPYLIDVTLPKLLTLRVNGGATHTADPKVKVRITASDAHSGLNGMRFSLDGQQWTNGWKIYHTGDSALDLSDATLGGNSNEGVKWVHAQVRDKAGNLSAAFKVPITYLRAPVLRTATISSLPSVNAKYYRLTGAQLAGVNKISFAGKTITSKWNSTHNSAWVNGYFRIFGDTVIYLYPPQGLAPGSYEVQVHNAAAASNKLQLSVTANTGRVIRSAQTMLQNGLQTIYVTRGKLPVGTSTIIMASPSKQPSVLPGVFDFGIGKGFSAYFLLPELGFNAQGLAKLAFPVLPAVVGHTLYFQAGYLNQQQPVWPMPTSDVWATSYVK